MYELQPNHLDSLYKTQLSIYLSIYILTYNITTPKISSCELPTPRNNIHSLQTSSQHPLSTTLSSLSSLLFSSFCHSPFFLFSVFYLPPSHLVTNVNIRVALPSSLSPSSIIITQQPNLTYHSPTYLPAHPPTLHNKQTNEQQKHNPYPHPHPHTSSKKYISYSPIRGIYYVILYYTSRSLSASGTTQPNPTHTKLTKPNYPN